LGEEAQINKNDEVIAQKAMAYLSANFQIEYDRTAL
jgi:hypothetical protein